MYEEITTDALFTYSVLLGQNSNQDLVFTPTSCQNCNLPKSDFVNRIITDSLTASAHVFAVQSLDDFVDDHGAITVDLGASAINKITFYPTYFETDIEVDYVWMGKDTSGDNTLLIAGNQGYFAGYVGTKADQYEILPVTNGYSMIRKLDHLKFPEVHCGLTDSVGLAGEAIPPHNQIDLCEEDNICASTVDILALIPPDVVEWYGEEFANYPWAAALHLFLGHYTFLFAMIESGYPDIRIRVSFAGIDFPYSSIDHRTNVYNILPVVADQARAAYRADLVMLSTSVNYSDAVYGVANVGEYDENGFWEAPCFDCAYGIAEIRFMWGPRWVLAHEIAHLFSARHNDDGLGDECGHGYRFKTEVGANRTVMHTMSDGEAASGHSKILAFSTPDVTIDNIPIGTETFSNNALLINNAACKVEDYFEPAVLGARINNISGPVLCSLIGSVNNKQLTAEIIPPAQGFPGNPPYTYEWRWKSDGVFSSSNPGVLLGTNDNVIIDFAHDCPSFFVKLSVTSSDGEVATATTQISTTLCAECFEDGLGGNQPEQIFARGNSINEDSEIVVFPNPVTEALVISGVEVYESIEVVDIYGRTFISIQNMGKHPQMRLETADLKPGLYFLRLSSAAGDVVTTFTKNQ